jgi:hypothetical protein
MRRPSGVKKRSGIIVALIIGVELGPDQLSSLLLQIIEVVFWAGTRLLEILQISADRAF